MEYESFNVHRTEELLQSALYTNAKKVSSAILKAIQTELNMNSLDWGQVWENTYTEKMLRIYHQFNLRCSILRYA